MRRNNQEVNALIDVRHDVLDHGSVTLVDVLGDDLTVVNAARVSFGGDATGRTDEENQRLISYLLQHDHGVPFEHCAMSFIVEAPIQIARQWAKHRISSMSEISGRYAELEEKYYIPDLKDISLQSKSNKQGRGEEVDPLHADMIQGDMATSFAVANRIYRGHLAEGIAKEIARGVLPLNTYTKFRWTVNLRSLFNFMKLRMDSHAQLEIRKFSEVIHSMFARLFPMCSAAFDKHVLHAVKLSADEVKTLIRLLDDYGAGNSDIKALQTDAENKVIAKLGL